MRLHFASLLTCRTLLFQRVHQTAVVTRIILQTRQRKQETFTRLWTSFDSPRSQIFMTTDGAHLHAPKKHLSALRGQRSIFEFLACSGGKGLCEDAGSLGQLDVCGRAPLSDRIVGGENATAGSWLWQVSIHVIGFGHNCGGTLITKDWVLSAAHCFENIDVSKVVMYFGRLRQFGSNPNETSRTASRIITHPNYNSKTIDNDIALVQLNSSVNFSDYVKPVCLAAAGSVFDAGTESWVTGWGKLQPEDTQLSNTLQQVMMPIVSNSDCNRAYFRVNRITSNMICAGFLNQEEKSICPGDSGGPVLSRNGSLWIQSGISSFTTQKCDDPRYPSVFARVSRYQDWIKSFVGNNTPGFVEFNPTSNSNFGSVPNPLLFTFSLTFSIIPFTFSLYLAS